MRGGPFAHRLRDGVCRVCGWLATTEDDAPGCPYTVNMVTYQPGAPLVSAGTFERAARELRAMLAKGKDDGTPSPDTES